MVTKAQLHLRYFIIDAQLNDDSGFEQYLQQYFSPFRVKIILP